MNRVLLAVALLISITKTSNGFSSIHKTGLSLRIEAILAVRLDSALFATKKKKRKQGKPGSKGTGRNTSSSGFGFNDSKSKPTVRDVPRIRALRQLSTEPLIFTIDDFVSPETCLALQQPENKDNQHDEDRLNFVSLIASELFAGQWGPNDGLRWNQASSSDANNINNGEYSCFPEGLHVDTNNDSLFRSVTLILYLNDVPVECGGATVFPLAGVPDGNSLLEASSRLLTANIGHTRGAAGSNGVLPGQEADALLLEQMKSQQGNGIRVQPQAGRLCIFFSRTEDGAIDARSWHGGERLLPTCSPSASRSDRVRDEDEDNAVTVTEKSILTLFKEVSYGDLQHKHPDDYTITSFENYLAPQIAEQREALQLVAASHAGFF